MSHGPSKAEGQEEYHSRLDEAFDGWVGFVAALICVFGFFIALAEGCGWNDGPPRTNVVNTTTTTVPSNVSVVEIRPDLHDA